MYAFTHIGYIGLRTRSKYQEESKVAMKNNESYEEYEKRVDEEKQRRNEKYQIFYAFFNFFIGPLLASNHWA